jgi:type II secretory pathway pseudopilin PulG
VEKRPQIVNRKSDPPLPHRRTGNEPSSSGFTSIELIVVIIALSILAGTAVVSFRFSDQDKSTIAADQLIADIQYVQMRAMGIGSQQNISFSTGTSSYGIREGTNIIEQKNLPDDVIIRNANFNGSNILTFNTLGEPTFSSSANGTVDLGKGASPNTTITVLAITGKVQ